MRGKIAGLAAAAIIIGGVQMASAADMAVKARPMVEPVALYNWTGFYLGINGGYGWDRSRYCTEATFGVSITCADGEDVGHTARGWLAGGHLGFRYQWSNWLLGIEGMWDGADIHGSQPGVAAGRVRGEKIKSLYSVTGSLGMAWDRFALYGKGGWAGARADLNADNTLPGGFSLGASTSLDGWTAGFGLLYGVNEWLDVGIEYNHYGFRHSDITNLANSGGNVIACAFCGIRQDVDTITARLDVRFNSWIK